MIDNLLFLVNMIAIVYLCYWAEKNDNDKGSK